ncbi:DUF2798 domain-containing protein [Arenibaculum sp.]|jgi:hypothetical protein|uniref:DUF2798 domain-containing protein n=1 Tax=Arenibaculum sp. TaxID=2865862 RepID=UPI002E0EC59A|nr:DUF2798 domain-containing protein [Arenibaculum sp.]
MPGTNPTGPHPSRRKLPARYNGIVVPLLLSVVMSAVVSAIATLKSVGLADGVAATWLGAWGASWIVAFPTLLVVLPAVRRVAAAIVQPVER